jgi:FMN phosphatase YigB (HAD superfamily)
VGPQQNITAAWNSMLLDIPNERIMLIKELSKKYNLFLLSNTNEIHYDFIEDYYRSQFEDVSFSSLFSKVYLSYQIGYRKPNREIFEEVIKDAKINSSTTLFIDDSLEHVQTAKAMGIKAIHLNLNQQQSLITLFNEY